MHSLQPPTLLTDGNLMDSSEIYAGDKYTTPNNFQFVRHSFSLAPSGQSNQSVSLTRKQHYTTLLTHCLLNTQLCRVSERENCALEFLQISDFFSSSLFRFSVKSKNQRSCMHAKKQQKTTSKRGSTKHFACSGNNYLSLPPLCINCPPLKK